MLGLGLASSHVWLPDPVLKVKDRVNGFLTRHPEWEGQLPPRLRAETEEVLQGYLDRCNVAFGALREQVQAYRPDAIVVVGDDQYQMFDNTNNPTFAVFTGDEAWG